MTYWAVIFTAPFWLNLLYISSPLLSGATCFESYWRFRFTLVGFSFKMHTFCYGYAWRPHYAGIFGLCFSLECWNWTDWNGNFWSRGYIQSLFVWSSGLFHIAVWFISLLLYCHCTTARLQVWMSAKYAHAQWTWLVMCHASGWGSFLF